MYADGQFGMAVNGVVYVPPQPGVATIAVTKEGQLIMGDWGVDPRLNNSNTDLAAWRQNDALLINNGTINSLTQDMEDTTARSAARRGVPHLSAIKKPLLSLQVLSAPLP